MKPESLRFDCWKTDRGGIEVTIPKVQIAMAKCSSVPERSLFIQLRRAHIQHMLISFSRRTQNFQSKSICSAQLTALVVTENYEQANIGCVLSSLVE